MFQSPKVIRLQELTDVLTHHMKSLGVNNVHISTQNNLQRKTFGSLLLMFPDESGKILVMPEQMSTVDLAKENQNLKNELALGKSRHSGLTFIEQSAYLIRSAIKSGQPQKPWPFLPEHLSPDSIYLYRYMSITSVL